MADGQLDLFAGSGVSPACQLPPAPRPPAASPSDLDDAALLAGIPASGLPDGPALAQEAGRRRIKAAIPVLETYCRRFAGFGLAHPLREQRAALDALAAIGGPEAAASVARIITCGWVQGPTLAHAVAAAARLHSRLPADIVLPLLRHAEPAIRADACRLARGGPDIVATLVDLVGDLHPNVAIEAACALARLGRPESCPSLKRLLTEAPSTRVIEAVPPVADEECVVLLGRIARSASSELAAAARDALDATEHPLAAKLLERLS
jgi:HEAT repeat protein